MRKPKSKFRKFFGNLTATSAVFLMAASSGRIFAEQIVFTIDHSQSTIAWSGTTGGAFGPGSIVEQSTGSLSAAISGHFLLDFNPSGVPSSLNFIEGDGYYQLDSSYTAQPGGGLANVAGQSSNPGFTFAVRNLAWDIFTPPGSPVTGSGGVFPASATYFKILSGGLDSNVGSEDYTGAQNNLDSGTWTLSESGGTWTLAASTVYSYGDSNVQFTTNANIVSTAHFAPANVVHDVPSQATAPVVVQVNGAQSGAPGGVSITLPQLPPGSTETGVTSVTVQEIPNVSGISQEAIEAAQSIPIFAAALESVADGGPQNLQIWNVHPTGFINGTSATLVFNYDPSLFPDIDQSQLGIWHYNKISSHWDWGRDGEVDLINHTITFTTTSFSDFVAGVPEPSTFVLGTFGLIGLAVYGWRRKR